MLISAIRSATNRSLAGGARSGLRPGRGRAVPGPCTDMIMSFPPGAPLVRSPCVRAGERGFALRPGLRALHRWRFGASGGARRGAARRGQFGPDRRRYAGELGARDALQLAEPRQLALDLRASPAEL